ncbi:hypothetical protein SAMN02927923_01408 [Microvirga guangxiensis]|uniref:Lipoprotein n=1 Tax=Microvirga guangxiensis TaxID=549386 RepID=A0A1G5G7U9_9HYPH|nr:hypothetical protein SAMN02927923_01408 [Microvirga guangxiensis]
MRVFAKIMLTGMLLLVAACSVPRERLHDGSASPRIQHPVMPDPSQAPRRWPAYSIDRYGNIYC